MIIVPNKKQACTLEILEEAAKHFKDGKRILHRFGSKWWHDNNADLIEIPELTKLTEKVYGLLTFVRLEVGETVYWNDPDRGISSGYYIIDKDYGDGSLIVGLKWSQMQFDAFVSEL